MVSHQVGAVRDRVGDSVERRVAAEVVSRAVPVVRAALHPHRDDATGAVSVLGVHGVLLDVDLRHRVHIGHVGAFCPHQLRHTVDQNVVLGARVAAHVHLAGGPMVVSALLSCRADDDRRVQRGQ